MKRAKIIITLTVPLPDGGVDELKKTWIDRHQSERLQHDLEELEGIRVLEGKVEVEEFDPKPKRFSRGTLVKSVGRTEGIQGTVVGHNTTTGFVRVLWDGRTTSERVPLSTVDTLD